jgi:hypothetical protein
MAFSELSTGEEDKKQGNKDRNEELNDVYEVHETGQGDCSEEEENETEMEGERNTRVNKQKREKRSTVGCTPAR